MALSARIRSDNTAEIRDYDVNLLQADSRATVAPTNETSCVEQTHDTKNDAGEHPEPVAKISNILYKVYIEGWALCPGMNCGQAR